MEISINNFYKPQYQHSVLLKDTPPSTLSTYSASNGNKNIKLGI